MPARHFEVEMAKPQPAARMEEGVMEDSEDPENNNNYSTIELFVKWITTEEVEFHWLSLVLYVCFVLATFMFAIVQKQPSPDAYYLTNAIVDNLFDSEFPDINGVPGRKTFRDIGEELEVWRYLHGPFRKLFQNCANQTDIQADIKCHARMHQNTYVLDQFILTQVRVKPVHMGTGKCVLPGFAGKGLKSALHKCYFAYEDGGTNVDTSLWSNKTVVPDTIAPCFKVNPTPFSDTFGGFHTLDYGNRGYTCLGESVGDSFPKLLGQLHQYNYVDEGTRAIYIDFTAYSPSLGLVVYITIGFEFLAAGSVYPYYTTNTILSEENIAQNAVARVLVFTLFYILVACYSAKLTINFVRAKDKRKFCKKRRLLDTINFSTLVLIAVLFITKSTQEQHARQASDAFAKRNALQAISTTDDFIDWILTFNALLTVFKSFQYLKLSKKMSVIIRTMKRAAEPLAFSALTVLAVVFGYSVAFHVAFGSKLSQFRTLGHSFMTCMTSMFIDVELRAELWYSNRILGPLLLISYMVFVTFIVMSLCLAIVETAFHEVRVEMKKESDHTDAFSKMKRRLSNKIKSMHLGDRAKHALHIDDMHHLGDVAKHALHIGEKRGCVICFNKWERKPDTDLREVPKEKWSTQHSHCEICFHKFSIVRRRHHCRYCGKSICDHDSKFLTKTGHPPQQHPSAEPRKGAKETEGAGFKEYMAVNPAQLLKLAEKGRRRSRKRSLSEGVIKAQV